MSNSSSQSYSVKEKDFADFASVCGVPMNRKVLRSVIELLELNVSPASIAQMLHELSIIRSQEKLKRAQLAQARQQT